jgi:hypothetical protein
MGEPDGEKPGAQGTGDVGLPIVPDEHDLAGPGLELVADIVKHGEVGLASANFGRDGNSIE